MRPLSHLGGRGLTIQRRSDNHTRAARRVLPGSARWRGLRRFRACPRGRVRRHEDIGEGPTAHIQHRPRARWSLKGRQSSLA